MSIRLRLTLLYSVILALTLIAFSALLYLTLSRVTSNALRDQLVAEARTLIAASELRRGSIALPATRFSASDTFVQTLALDGSVEDRTANLYGYSLPLSAEGMRAVQDGKTWVEPGSIQGERLLIYTTPVDLLGRSFGILQVARSLEERDRSLTALQTVLLLGGGVATVVAFGVGWVLAGLALQPVTRITHTARAIGAGRDFGQRVDYAGPPDEVGRLATTFNNMLGELEAAYRQVEQALQAQRRLVGDASHELRTPLTTIRGNLGLLQREPPIAREDREAALADMVDETDRLIRLVNDLLALARADAGHPRRNEPIRIKPIVEDVCRQAKLLEGARAITCNDVPDLVAVGNRDGLKQVLLALVDNAVKFTPAGGRIMLTGEVVADQVAISVRDTGSGIDPAVLRHIFERFYRGDTARTGTGFGLGLAIAKMLVEAQDGSLTVQSEVGKGSVFTITLPPGVMAVEVEERTAVATVA